MTGFLSIGNYSAFLVLAAGLTTSAALFGIGNVIGRRMRLPQPWAGVVGSIAAIEAFALLLTIISIAHIAYAVVLIVAWAVLVVAGGVALIANLRREKPRIHVDAGTASIVVFLLLQLMIAICPSTKGDELYYHMIVPARIVLDHGLRFYRSPFI
ncbi:MAG TPA: hypothetical protein VI391_05240, partial [Thermoanaerobaculia bacterium]